jgi:hypothetical protein
LDAALMMNAQAKTHVLTNIAHQYAQSIHVAQMLSVMALHIALYVTAHLGFVVTQVLPVLPWVVAQILNVQVTRHVSTLNVSIPAHTMILVRPRQSVLCIITRQTARAHQDLLETNAKDVRKVIICNYIFSLCNNIFYQIISEFLFVLH